MSLSCSLCRPKRRPPCPECVRASTFVSVVLPPWALTLYARHVCADPHALLSALALMCAPPAERVCTRRRSELRGDPDKAISVEPEPRGSIQRGGRGAATAQHADLLKGGGTSCAVSGGLAGPIMLYNLLLGAPLGLVWQIRRVTRRRAAAGTETSRGCAQRFIAIVAPSGPLLIRVRHKQGQPDRLKRCHPTVTQTDASSASFIGDKHRGFLRGKQVMDDT